MRTLRKFVIGMGLAGALALGITWGSVAPATQHTVSAALIGHMVLASAPPVNIQKPGH